MMIKYRVHEVAKDLNVPNKDVIDLLNANFEGQKKHMTALNEDELDVVFESFTQKHAMENLDAYFADREAEPEAAPVEKAAPVQQPAPKAEPAPQQPAAKKPANEDAQKKQQPPKPQNQKRPEQRPQPQKSQPAPVQQKPAEQPAVDTSAVKRSQPDGWWIRVLPMWILERYNEKYDRLASEKGAAENTVQKQKLTQRSHRSTAANPAVPARRRKQSVCAGLPMERKAEADHRPDSG